MLSGKLLRKQVTGIHNQAATGIERFGVVGSILGGFFKRISGKTSQDLDDEEEGLLSSSTSSTSSDEGVKR